MKEKLGLWYSCIFNCMVYFDNLSNAAKNIISIIKWHCVIYVETHLFIFAFDKQLCSRIRICVYLIYHVIPFFLIKQN